MLCRGVIKIIGGHFNLGKGGGQYGGEGKEYMTIKLLEKSLRKYKFMINYNYTSTICTHPY